jgi:hypothetical protein
MEKKNKNLRILTLVSLVLGSAFNAYGQQDKAIVIKPQTEIRVDPIRIYGHAEVAIANNFMLKYPAKTDLKPSLITSQSDKDFIDNVAFDANVKLGFETKFYVEEKITKAVLEFSADTETVKLAKLYFENNGWSAGLKPNNFCNIATFAPQKVLLLGWNKEINSNFTFGISLEQAKKFEFYPEDKKEEIEKSKVKLRQELPAVSTRVQYNFADKFASVELSLLARPMGIYNTITKKTAHEFGYGANLGTKFNFVPKKDKMTFNVVFGEGIGNYITDLKEMGKIEENTAYIKPTATGTDVKLISAVGAHAIYEHRWTSSVRFSIAAGGTNILNSEKQHGPKKYLRGGYAAFKLMYFPTKKTGFGVEYMGGAKVTLDENYEHAHHLKALAEFKF